MDYWGIIGLWRISLFEQPKQFDDSKIKGRIDYEDDDDDEDDWEKTMRWVLRLFGIPTGPLLGVLW